MTVAKAQRRAKARQLETTAWALYCDGHSMAEIAAQHHVTRQAVHKAIKRAVARAMDGLTDNIREKKAAQVARLERIAELAMESYRKSCRDATKKTRRSRMCGASRTFDEAITTTEQAGDPRFLDQARGALADIRKILGMDAPTRVAVTEPDRPLADVPTEDLLKELDELRQVFELLQREVSAPYGIDSARIIADLERLRDPAGDLDHVLFRTPRQIADATSQQVDWIVRGFMAAGAITEITGKAKAAGKTTLLSYLCRCVLDGALCLGDERAMQSPIVFLTEQAAHTFREFLRRSGLLEGDRRLLVLDYWSVAGRQWPEIAQLAHQQAQRIGARLIVVDTLAQFAGLRGEAENNAGDALAALEPLQRIAATGIGVVITRHERKGGGEVGESGRGSSAFTGAVDIVLSLKRLEGRQRPTLRVLEGLSRFDETPSKIVIELVSEPCAATGVEVCAQSFRVVGDTDAAALDEVAAQLERLLPPVEANAVTIR